MPRVELITWQDAYNKEGRWRSIKSLRSLKPEVVTTVGFVVHEDETGIVTASDIDSEGTEVHGVSYIPTSMILSRTVLA